jgi:4-diphosphocytidyl-2-C-methyl-D-erythritol kinase
MANFNGECLVWSPCKINPTLEVLERRPDGMHTVVTSLLALDLCDRVRVRCSDISPGESAMQLSCAGPASTPDIPLDGSNLAWRGAQVVLDLASERGLELGATRVALHIEKLIPSQAGLGGGSSNAAAAAFGLAQLLGIDHDDGELQFRLGQLGADVAFFMAARRTGWGLCTGRGEQVEPRLLPALGQRVFVVWTPRLTCSTASVYQALSTKEMHREVRTRRFDDCLCLPVNEARFACRNDLEAPALRSHGELLEFKSALESGGPGVAGLCGSGSSYYGIFDSQNGAEAFLAQSSIARIERDFGLRAQFIARARGAGVGC